MTNRLNKNLLFNFLGQGWSGLMGLAFIPLYIKYLGVEAYGLVGLYALMQAWLSLLDLGMTPALGREMGRYIGGAHSNQSIRDLLRSIEVVSFLLAFVILIIVTLSGEWIASSWLQSNDLPTSVINQAIVIMGFVAALRFVEATYKSAIVGLQKQVLFNKINIILSTFRGLGVVGALIIFEPTIQVFFLWQAAVSLLAVVVLNITTYKCLSKHRVSGRFSISALQQIWRFAAGLTIISIQSVILTQVDKVFLSKFLSLEEFGYYTLAAAISGCLPVFIQPVVQAVYPKFCELLAKNDEDGLFDLFHIGAQLIAVSTISVVSVLIFFSDTFLLLWTQDIVITNNVSKVFCVLLFGHMLNGLTWIPYQAQLAYGWTSLVVRVNIFSICVIPPVLFWIIPKYGPLGAACVWLVLNLGYCLFSVPLMFRKILKTEMWSWYLHDIIKPLVLIFATVALSRMACPDVKVLHEQVLTLATVSFIALSVGIIACNRLRPVVISKIVGFYDRLSINNSASK